ncbi:hypothetical protein ACRAWF_28935 [Streptomyces sp. L7]
MTEICIDQTSFHFAHSPAQIDLPVQRLLAHPTTKPFDHEHRHADLRALLP